MTRFLIKKMASGGVGRLATKNTCSICLEPFKGRFPKLLPCFHTFCLPCLTQMVTRTVSQVGQFGSGQTETIITCPTCRKDCVVPSGGVTELQKNFYLEQDEDNPGQGHLQPIICDLCDQGQVASHRCTRCQLNLCFHCHRGHSNCQIAVRANSERDDVAADENVEQLIQKGRDQITVMERMLNKLAGDESELNRQRKKLEDTLRKVKLHADAEEDKMKKNKADLKTKLDALSQLLFYADHSSLSAATLKSFLLSDTEVSTMRDKTSDDRPTNYFKALSGSLNLGSASEANGAFDDSLLFGDGSQLPLALEASQLQQATRMNELAQKVDMLMRQAHEQKTRGENKELVAEIRAMHDKNTILLQEVAAFQAENGKLQKDFADMQRTFMTLQETSKQQSSDFSDLKTDIGQLKEKVKVGSEIPTGAQAVGGTGGESSSLAVKLSDCESEVKQLTHTMNQVLLDKALTVKPTRVAFHASLGPKVVIKTERILICKNVAMNVGDGYDSQTGKFKAQISGLYCFGASVLAAYVDKPAKIAVMMHDFSGTFPLFVCQCSHLTEPAVGQTVIFLKKGDVVWPETYKGISSYDGQTDGTYFSGFLVEEKQ